MRAFVLILAGLCLGAGVFAADTYAIDPVHSAVIFKIKHMNVSYFYGRINNPSGTIVIDEHDASKCSVEFALKIEDIDTANVKREEHLKNADFFDAENHPGIVFKSKSVSKEGDVYSVKGDLTLMNVTKEIEVKLTRIGSAKDPRGDTRTGFDGSFTVKRSEFGMDKALDSLSDEVTLILGIQAILAKAEPSKP